MCLQWGFADQSLISPATGFGGFRPALARERRHGGTGCQSCTRCIFDCKNLWALEGDGLGFLRLRSNLWLTWDQNQKVVNFGRLATRWTPSVIVVCFWPDLPTYLVLSRERFGARVSTFPTYSLFNGEPVGACWSFPAISRWCFLHIFQMFKILSIDYP